MSVTSRSSAAWTVTWKYWRKLCVSDTWLPQRQTRSVSRSAETSYHNELPRLVGIIHTVASSPYQVVIRSTKTTHSFWRNVPMSTSVATPPPLDPSSLKVSTWCTSRELSEGGDMELFLLPTLKFNRTNKVRGWRDSVFVDFEIFLFQNPFWQMQVAHVFYTLVNHFNMWTILI